ncbi:MAG: hypothetical protein HYZ89_07135 [Candidatus Omnitrophica bacterium]|nr:hypothetical protein [Candidatus Omnitrophota bacterium]
MPVGEWLEGFRATLVLIKDHAQGRGLLLVGILRRPIQVYLLLLYGLSCFYLIGWPVIAGDTDLWYHLNGGRYLFEHHAIAHESFFSFVSPPRVWVNYYWLFQVVVYLLYSWGGYLGLVVFRSAMYLATVWLVFLYLSRGQERQASSAWWVFIAVLCGLLLIPRSLLIRPHLFTYGFIVAFLYLLEYRPRSLMLLPALAVLWCNFHGITYPVMWWILMAYGAERLLLNFAQLHDTLTCCAKFKDGNPPLNRAIVLRFAKSQGLCHVISRTSIGAGSALVDSPQLVAWLWTVAYFPSV